LATNPAAREEWARDQKLRDDPRVTRLGRFLRKTSLDELPQLINVLRGEMNLVGPRPILESEIPRYGASFRHYCTVKPGITGLWQVSGRNNTSYRKRVALDVLYARRRSAGLDLLILLRTVPAVLLRQGSC
jgi:lipopolysaccharide/colanic/teichoic acid biosynthesis glycosyltransferase